MLARLTRLLPKIISRNQSGFIKGRYIHENIALASELTHDTGRKTRGGNFIIKPDLAIAYIRLSWSYLMQVM